MKNGTSGIDNTDISRAENYYTVPPPGTINIADNIFYDQTETRNLDWLEYMFWTGRVYGIKSKEYKATLPDTMVWVSDYKCLNNYSTSYLRHPAFRDYPVVGISRKQGLEFSKWRSDRVFEYILINKHVIKWNEHQNKDTVFSIETYFNGKYMGIKPDSNFRYYPCFRLPTIKEYKAAVKYNDSLDNSFQDKFQSDIIPCQGDSFRVSPTALVSLFKSKNKRAIANLKGNVREWASEDETSVGGGWHDTHSIILTKDTFAGKDPNAWTGMRNICEWVLWNRNGISQKAVIKCIKQGRSYGMCHGYCQTETVVTSDKRITTQKAWSRGDDSASFPDKVESTRPITAAEWSRLTQMIDKDAFFKLPATIGCPDCDDRGAEWIEIVIGDKTYKVTFETWRNVDELDALRKALKEMK
ncbi:MAG TPA: SUMF1/EgtB/PvdO family nonheme iron enzyme [Bacteroidia bacterium]|nr:SUMF1/EgtB/PvdO family nonheme iron enzyme [Bacteroidia bacterium]